MSGAHIMFQAHVEYNSPPVIIKPVIIIIIMGEINKIHPILKKKVLPNRRTACITRMPIELSGVKHEMKKQP
jgi:hypothetical protein